MQPVRLSKSFPWLFLHLTSLKVHAATPSNEFMFSAGCDEDVWGTNVKLSKCLTCHQGPSNFAAIVGLSHIYMFSGFGGLGVACWPLVPKFAGSNPAETFGFLGRKNPQHAFLWRGSKAVGPMS